MVSSTQARELLSRHGTCVTQESSDWIGSIALPVDIAQFYAQVGPRNIEIVGYGNPTFMPSLAQLWDHQAGYRWNGLTGEPIDNWPDHWVVVADKGADPYIYDAEVRRILYAQHGTGSWNAGEIYPDLNTMAGCIATLGGVVMDAEDFTDEDCLINPQYREQAVSLLTSLLGSSSEAEAIVTTAGWG